MKQNGTFGNYFQFFFYQFGTFLFVPSYSGTKQNFFILKKWYQNETKTFQMRQGFLKVVGKPERRGVRNVSNDPNLSRTAAIDVLFFINLAVIFDFFYFRFRPSKAKSIGNVLPNRLNAANYLQHFFLLLILFAASFR
jgi:hypothetical protein